MDAVFSLREDGAGAVGGTIAVRDSTSHTTDYRKSIVLFPGRISPRIDSKLDL